MNAREELLKNVRNLNAVKCIDISYCAYGGESRDLSLVVGFDEKEAEEFLDSMEFEYDDEYGTQELYGTIWMKDGSWYEHWEYDGSEGWEYKASPEIPKNLYKD